MANTQITIAPTSVMTYAMAISSAVSLSSSSTNIALNSRKSETIHTIIAITIDRKANLCSEGIIEDDENKLTIRSMPQRYNKYLNHLSKINLLNGDVCSTIINKLNSLLFNLFKKSMPDFARSMPLFSTFNDLQFGMIGFAGGKIFSDYVFAS